MDKICLFCCHFYIDGGSPGYSRYTPGDDASVGCNLDHWILERYDTSNSYRLKMEKAENCGDFESDEYYKKIVKNPDIPKDCPLENSKTPAIDEEPCKTCLLTLCKYHSTNFDKLFYEFYLREVSEDE